MKNPISAPRNKTGAKKQNQRFNFYNIAAKIFSLVFCVISVLTVFQSETFAAKHSNEADEQTPLWTPISKQESLSRLRSIAPEKYAAFHLDRSAMRQTLAKAPLEFTDAARANEVILSIPTPDGKFQKFRIEESPMLAPEIAAQFPTWKTFQGQGIDDPMATARFDININGFHGYVIGSGGSFLINPFSREDLNNYIIYYKTDLSSDYESFTCRFKNNSPAETNFLGISETPFPTDYSNGAQLKNFRLAVSATRFYTNHFNSQTAALAAIQTTVNRMITIYRRELATTFTLVSGTNTIFTDANNGGFTNNSTTDVERNQVVLDQIIGNNNYDIGHVLSVTPNPDGLAASPSLCNSMAKAQGFTGSSTPQGDGYDVDYVAHEIGHQFGMSHTFNNDADGSCNTREADSAYEPASGVTIMGYAGICAPRNLSANSIEYFHARSFVQSLEYRATISTCGTTTATGNTPPANVSAGANYTIPKLTPFTLTASAQDTDPNLTYSWEEYDLGAATRSTGAVDSDEDGTARPIFRSYNPSSQPSRTFPSLHYILNSNNTPPATYTGSLPFATSANAAGYACQANQTCVTGERLPSIARTMNFRVTVRDNNPNGGGIADAATQITVDAASGPFRVTTQDTPASWQAGTQQTIAWNVANTNNAPVNAQNVKISLSTDGGNTFPIVLANSVPNNGSAQVTVPNNATTQARIKIEAVGNVFFDINNSNFTITGQVAAPRTPFDFDGDGKADISVFRPTGGGWYRLNSSNNSFFGTSFGIAEDRPAPADFDGDGKADISVFRPSNGTWYRLNSSNGQFVGTQFGTAGDLPMPGDFDGDGKADVSVFRPSNGTWYRLNSSNGQFVGTQFGQNGDVPILGDFDGDTKSDLAVFRPAIGAWYITRSSNNSFSGTSFGQSGDIPTAADYDGDGKTDIAVYRPSVGGWYRLNSGNGQFNGQQFGVSEDRPVAADYDGDARADLAVFRPSSGTWYLLRSTAGFAGTQFGTGNDKPSPAAFLP